MPAILIQERVGFVAALLLFLVVPTAKADPLTIYNDATVPVTVRLDGGYPYIEPVTLAPGTSVTREVSRAIPNRRVTVIDHSTNTAPISSEPLFLSTGITAITVTNFPTWEIIYGH